MNILLRIKKEKKSRNVKPKIYFSPEYLFVIRDTKITRVTQVNLIFLVIARDGNPPKNWWNRMPDS